MCDSSKDYILCESCAADDQINESGVPAATMHCITCEESQCDSCTKVHRKLKLTKDHSIVPIEEIIKKKVSKMNEPSKYEEKTIFCDICNVDNEDENDEVPKATMFCINCQESQCDSCSKVHRKQKLSKSHNIVSLAEIMREKITRLFSEILREKLIKLTEPSKSEERIIFCDSCKDDIENENDEIPTATMFCMTCEENQCDTCTNVHRKQKISKDHSIIPLKEKIKEKLNKMKEPSKSEEVIIFCESCNVDKENEDDEVPTATMFCTNCEESQCDSCSRVHRKQKLSKDHSIVSLTEQMKEKLNKMKEPSKSDEEIIFCDSTNVDKENENDKKQEKKTSQETPRDLMISAIKNHKEYKLSKGIVKQSAGTDKIPSVKPCDDASKAIWGFAKINDDVFLLRDSNQSSESEIFLVKEERFQYLWKISGIPLDMAGDSKNRRLYISRFIEPENEIMISAHDINKAGWPNETPNNYWRVRVGRYLTLSITSESNVLLTLMERRKLIEFTYNGEVEKVLHDIEIADIANPLHAVKQSSDTYVVCHGENREEKQGVCIVNAQGHLLKEFCLRNYSNMKISVVPMYLALDRKGSIMVAENRNGRVVKLNSDLTVAKVLLNTCIKDGMRGPCRLHMDETSGKIIMASNGHGWIGGKLLIRDI